MLDSFYSNPMFYIGAAFATAAALAFVVFLAGILSGAKHLFTFDVHQEHLDHARTRAVWGLGWLIILFLLWQLLRWIGGFFS